MTLEEDVHRFLNDAGRLRDTDGFCLACGSWSEHDTDCSFIALWAWRKNEIEKLSAKKQP